MKRVLPVVIVILFGLHSSCSEPEKQADSPSVEQKIDSLVQPYLDSMQVAGLAVGVARGDSVIFKKAYGYADLEFDVSMPVEASFEIGSVTKQFTAVAILQLAEKDSLTLEDSLNEYLEFDTEGRKITIRQLLNHTSGIKGYTEMKSFGSIAPFRYDRDTLLRLVEKESFDFEPGEQMIYNNTAFFMLGLIIEKVSGMSFEEYVQQYLFEPAGMGSSYYCSSNAIRKNRAHGYGMSDEGLVRADYLDHVWPYSAGSLCSTIDDLLKWNYTLHQTNKLINQESYEQLITPARLNDETPLRYGLGLALNEFNGISIISHGGGIPGFLSDSRYIPSENLTIVTLVNTTGPLSPENVSMFVAGEMMDLESGLNREYKGSLSTFEGHYEGTGRGSGTHFDVTAADGRLIVERNGEQDTLEFVSGNTWKKDNQYLTFTFEGDTVSGVDLDVTYGYYRLKKTD